MAIDLLSVEEFQILKTAALVAAFFINRQAIIILAFTLAGEWLFATFNYNPVLYYCLAGLPIFNQRRNKYQTFIKYP